MMIDHICSRQGRRWLSSTSTSGWHGSRFDGLAIAAFLIVVGILTSAADAQTCASITDNKVDCLSTTPSAANFIQIACVSDFYKLTIQSAAIYQASNSGTGCPTSGPVNPTAIGACFSSNPSFCSTTAASCLYAVSTPSSNVGSCTGPFFVVTTYQCTPVFSTANTTTGSSTFMDNAGVISNTQVNIGNPTAPTGLFFYGPTNYTCSIYVPAGVEVKVGYNFLTKTSGAGCQWRIQIDDVANNPVVQFCNTSSPQSVSLGCGPNPSSPRYFLVRYIGDSSVGIFFAVFFQVRQGRQVIAQCGTPPFPLFSTPPTTTTAAATTRPATTIPPVAVTTAAAAVSTAGATSPPPSTPSGNGPSTAATSGAPNLVVTTAPSNPAATSVFPTPTSTNPPAAPATSNAATTAGNLVVTTAPSNNIPTSAPVAPSPTTPSNNAGATSVPSTPTLSPPAAPVTTAGAVAATSVPSTPTLSPPAAPVTTAGAVAATSVPSTPVPTLSPPAAPVTTAGAVAETSPGAVTSGGATGSSIAGSSGVVVTQPSTPTSGGVSGWDQNATTGVIAGSVVAGAIILTIVAAVALWRRRSTEVKALLPEVGGSNNGDDVLQASAIEPVRSTNYQLDPHTYNSGPYRHVTGFYVDGNSRSNLVINRPPPPPPQQPFKTVLRLQ